MNTSKFFRFCEILILLCVTACVPAAASLQSTATTTPIATREPTATSLRPSLTSAPTSTSTSTPAPTSTPTFVPSPAPSSTLTLVPTPAPFILPPEAANPTRPTYSRPGEYPVAVISTALNQDTNPVKAYIFYPAKADGTPETTGAPYPLVIYSPGQGSSAMDYTYLLGKVASYGFMVLSLDRTNDPNDPTQPTQDYAPGVVSRTLDLKLLIDLGDRLTAPAGSLAGLIDMEKIAIAGYSWGGLDALVGGGARWSFGYCAVHLAEAGVVNFCIHVQPDLQEIANGLGLGSVPTGMWPTMNDPRVDAVIAMAPVGDMWGAAFEGVAAMKVPALIMTGTKDTNIDPQLFTLPLYRHLGSQKKSLVQFEGEDHFVFLGTDTDADLVSHFVVAFLLVELKGDAVAAKALAPASVTFQGVKYETTEFKTGQ